MLTTHLTPTLPLPTYLFPSLPLCSASHPCGTVTQLCPTLFDLLDSSRQAPLCPWGFSRQEYWSGLPCPPPGDLPNPGIKPSRIEGGFFTSWATREVHEYWSGELIPSPGDLPDPGIELASPAFSGGFFTSWATREAIPGGSQPLLVISCASFPGELFLSTFSLTEW